MWLPSALTTLACQSSQTAGRKPCSAGTGQCSWERCGGPPCRRVRFADCQVANASHRPPHSARKTARCRAQCLPGRLGPQVAALTPVALAVRGSRPKSTAGWLPTAGTKRSPARARPCPAPAGLRAARRTPRAATSARGPTSTVQWKPVPAPFRQWSIATGHGDSRTGGRAPAQWHPPPARTAPAAAPGATRRPRSHAKAA